MNALTEFCYGFLIWILFFTTSIQSWMRVISRTS